MEVEPVTIEAFQYDGDLKGKDGEYYVPQWAQEAYESGVMYYDELRGSPPCELFIKTRNGNEHVPVGYYIVRGIQDELYSCKPDTFKEWHTKSK